MIDDVREVRDHEEWLRLVEDSDSGLHIQHGFLVIDRDKPRSSVEKFVTDRKLVERGMAKLSKRFGWDEMARVLNHLVVGMTTHSSAVRGGWYLIVPEGYYDLFDSPERCEFRVRIFDRNLTFYAIEYKQRRERKIMFKEFDFNVFYARKGDDTLIYNDHPDAPAFYEAVRRGEIP